jgi:hypothetical protein
MSLIYALLLEMRRAYERGFSWYIGPGPGEQEGARESLKAPIALAINVLFRFFHFLGGYFQLFLVYLEKVKFT